MARVFPPRFNVKRVVFERDNYTCQKCGIVGEPGNRRGCVQIHHIKPRRDGGTNDIDNLVTLCVDCHKEIGTALGRPALSPDGIRMDYHSIAMHDALWAWAERGDTRSANVRKAVDAVRLLSPEQWAWLMRRDDAPAALEDAVRQAMTAQQEAHA